MENPGNPGLTSTSTSTGSASIPNRLRLLARHTLIRDTPPKPSTHPCLTQEHPQYIRHSSQILYRRILFYTKVAYLGAGALGFRSVRNSLRCRVAGSEHNGPTTMRAALECVLDVFYARSSVGGEDAYHVEA
jgi:hypothetical protein